MKAALVFLAVLAMAVAEPPSGYSSYAPPPSPARSAPQGAYGAPQEEAYQSQTFKNVYVYTAPDEPEDRQSRTIRVPGGDKHVNIIFVKTPSQSSSQQTEVILPEQDEHKSLVYVLLKKGENQADVKIRRPAPRQQPKPEVNFIRFEDQKQGGYAGAPAPSQQYGGPAPAPQTPSSTYGANF